MFVTPHAEPDEISKLLLIFTYVCQMMDMGDGSESAFLTCSAGSRDDGGAFDGPSTRAKVSSISFAFVFRYTFPRLAFLGHIHTPIRGRREVPSSQQPVDISTYRH